MPAAPAFPAARDRAGELPFSVTELKRIPSPSPEVFRREHVRTSRAVVVTGLTDRWLPLREWTADRLAARYGRSKVVAAVLAGGTLKDHGRRGVVFRHVELGAFVASLELPGAAADYVTAPPWDFPPAFQDDYRVPSYCAGSPHLRTKLWVGKTGTVTPFHRDLPHNFHVHLSGRKRWLLVAPRDSSRMYSRGLRSGMPNFSHVDPEAPDWTRHPRFRDVTVYGATLAPGETLFIPQGWWHHTRSLDHTVSMNFWWGGRLVLAAATASSAFKHLRGICSNEWK
jgi:hypothetical protein